jgi:hypothetical protein
MIDLNLEFTKDELLEAQHRLNPAARVLGIFGVLIAAFFLWNAYRTVSEASAMPATPSSRADYFATLVAAAIPLVFFAVIYVPVWVSLRKRLRQMRENPLMTGPRRVIIDETGIRSVHALSETFYRWEAVHRVLVTKRLYLLNVWSVVLIIPRRAIPVDQLQQFELLLRSRVNERTGGFPVRATPPPLPRSNAQQGQA